LVDQSNGFFTALHHADYGRTVDTKVPVPQFLDCSQTARRASLGCGASTAPGANEALSKGTCPSHKTKTFFYFFRSIVHDRSVHIEITRRVSKLTSTVGTMILEAFPGIYFLDVLTVQEGGRTSSIKRSFSRLNGLTNLTPCNDKPSCKSSVSMCLTPARCAEAHNIASQNVNRCTLTASSAAERSPTSAACMASRRAKRQSSFGCP
jgi:hypothetical protein